MKQLSLLKTSYRLDHGGSVRRGLRKTARPVDPKRPLHVVLRSSRARGAWSLSSLRHESAIKRLVLRRARERGVRVYRYANSGNHLHLLVKAPSREAFQHFLRTIGALIARLVTGARKGKPQGRFWDGLAWSRVVSWGRDFFEVKHDVILNELEGLGLWRRAWSNPQKRRPCRP